MNAGTIVNWHNRSGAPLLDEEGWTGELDQETLEIYESARQGLSRTHSEELEYE